MVRFAKIPATVFLVLLFSPLYGAESADDYAHLRANLIKQIENNVYATSSYLNKKNLDNRVMQAMATVPRHKFVLERYIPYAYNNRPLPIGEGQTISQPYIVAIMTDLLKIKPFDVVLEIGTGSGYQAAVLAELAEQVYTIEIIESLQKAAAKRLADLGYSNVTTQLSDGYYGWPEQAPFDAIMVTAAAGQIPPPLIQQLKPGGRMVIPVGGAFMTQFLIFIEKRPDGSLSTRQILPVRFVPFTGDH